MEKMLVAVFEDESKTYEGSRALNQLDDEGSIAIYAEAVIVRKPDGTTEVKQAGGEFPIGAISGTALGGLIGLMAGPVGLAAGMLAGTAAGSVADVYAAGVDEEFLADVSKALGPGRCAVVADVSEEWVTPVDTTMEKIGGVVLRTPKQDVQDDQLAKEVAALQAEMKQLKTEHAQARAERQAKLQAKIDNLQNKLQKKLEQANHRMEQVKSETDAKVQTLQAKASKARGDAKTAFEARIARIRERSEHATAKLENVTAPQVRKAG